MNTPTQFVEFREDFFFFIDSQGTYIQPKNVAHSYVKNDDSLVPLGFAAPLQLLAL